MILSKEIEWGLGHSCRGPALCLHRKQQALKSPNDDSFLASTPVEMSQECSGAKSDFLQVWVFSKHFQRRPDAEAELQLLPPTPDGTEPPAVLGCLGCSCQEGLVAWSCEMQLCKGGWFTLPLSSLCWNCVSLQAMVSHVLSKTWMPFTPCAIYLIPVLLSSWRHLGLSFEEILSTRTLCALSCGCGVLLASVHVLASPARSWG